MPKWERYYLWIGGFLELVLAILFGLNLWDSYLTKDNLPEGKKWWKRVSWKMFLGLTLGIIAIYGIAKLGVHFSSGSSVKTT